MTHVINSSYQVVDLFENADLGKKISMRFVAERPIKYAFSNVNEPLSATFSVDKIHNRVVGVDERFLIVTLNDSESDQSMTLEKYVIEPEHLETGSIVLIVVLGGFGLFLFLGILFAIIHMVRKNRREKKGLK